MRMVTTKGTLDGIDNIQVMGIVNGEGDCVAIKVVYSDGSPISWAMSDKQVAQFAQILEAVA